MRCAACGRTETLAAGERLAFGAECEGCGADLHSCRHCAHHDPAAYNGCRESSAERVLDAERANRCEYFRARASEGGAAGDGEREAALSALEDLFKKP